MVCSIKHSRSVRNTQIKAKTLNVALLKMMFCLHWNTCPWSAHTRILTFLQHNNIMKGTHMSGGCSCHGDGLFGAQPRVGNRPLWMNPVFRKSLLMTSSLSEEKKERQHVGRRYAAVTHVTFHTRWCNESGQKAVKSEQERAWWGWHFNQRMKDDEKGWAHRDWWRQRLSLSTQQPSPFTPELMLQKHKYSPQSQTHNDTKMPPNHRPARAPFHGPKIIDPQLMVEISAVWPEHFNYNNKDVERLYSSPIKL